MSVARAFDWSLSNRQPTIASNDVPAVDELSVRDDEDLFVQGGGWTSVTWDGEQLVAGLILFRVGSLNDEMLFVL